jgi:hypothetical protein
MTEKTAQEQIAELEDELESYKAIVFEVEEAISSLKDKQEDQKTDNEERFIAAQPDYYFRASVPTPSYSERPYVLPFGRQYPKLSPWDTHEHPFGKSWLAKETALICLRTDEPRTRPTRIIYTSGISLNETDKIGNEFIARHDQTNAKLGVYKIVGLVFYDREGDVLRAVGDTPNYKMSLNTYK